MFSSKLPLSYLFKNDGWKSLLEGFKELVVVLVVVDKLFDCFLCEE
jgi:hypothetical protein